MAEFESVYGVAYPLVHVHEKGVRVVPRRQLLRKDGTQDLRGCPRPANGLEVFINDSGVVTVHRHGVLEYDSQIMRLKGAIDPESCERFPVSDWQYEVGNGDTKLGFEEWLRGRVESEA